MIYLASPYTLPAHLAGLISPSDWRAARHGEVQAITAFYYKNRPELTIYSPIVHNHSLATAYDLPTDARFWLQRNLTILSLARELWVLHLPGIATSVGCRLERTHASAAKLHTRQILRDECLTMLKEMGIPKFLLPNNL